ncbi:pentapeptide repeat-containing protein [Fischerella sp.]|nr:pentapeptide repeat-containing protein [Fischerella sp.]
MITWTDLDANFSHADLTNADLTRSHRSDGNFYQAKLPDSK